jgi:penicillin G amidase
MKRLLNIGTALLLVVLALIAGLIALGLRSIPALDGDVLAKGISANVLIERDTADVTHIHAQTPLDAYRALGFVHAQERGWQLEFNRRLMHGELSEVFGVATLETDKLMRTLGIAKAAAAQFEQLPDNTRQALTAYSEGVAAYHRSNTARLAPEMALLGVRPGLGSPAWTPQDSVGWALMMALDLGGNWGTEAARLRVAQVMPTERVWQVLPPYLAEAPMAKVDFARLYAQWGVFRTATTAQPAAAAEPRQPSAAPEQTAAARWSADWLAQLGVVEGRGSNNWVVHGSKTLSGKPLLANDPHLALSAPAVWYFAGLHAPAGRWGDGSQHPELAVVGATLPGMPFVVLGRTERVAWGFTNTGPDVQDLYLEQIHPDHPQQYRTPEGWTDFDVRPETIRVKGQSDVQIQVRRTRHGPVISDAQSSYDSFLNKTRYAVALRWSALDADNKSAHAGLVANFAQSVPELKAAYADHHSPMQNVVMADVTGQVAYKAVGRVPLRAKTNDFWGMVPAPGWLPQYDWSGWLPYAQTPEDDPALTQARGWHATANERITPAGYPHFLGQDWTNPDRADRIRQLLDAKDKHSLHSMSQVMGDVHSLAALRILPLLGKITSTHALAPQALASLAQFNGQMDAQAAAPLILVAVVDEATRGLLSSKLGQANFDALYGKRHLRQAVETILSQQDPWWCGDTGCQAIVNAAFDRALDKLSRVHGKDLARWRWGQAHQALSSHKPMSNVPLLRALFDVRVPTGGDSFTVNVGQYWPNDPQAPYANRHAASLRAVYDLANLEDGSGFIYQTGQSGHPLSARYRDMQNPWQQLQFRPLRLHPENVLHSMVLRPAPTDAP